MHAMGPNARKEEEGISIAHRKQCVDISVKYCSISTRTSVEIHVIASIFLYSRQSLPTWEHYWYTLLRSIILDKEKKASKNSDWCWCCERPEFQTHHTYNWCQWPTRRSMPMTARRTRWKNKETNKCTLSPKIRNITQKEQKEDKNWHTSCMQFSPDACAWCLPAWYDDGCFASCIKIFYRTAGWCMICGVTTWNLHSDIV